MVRSQELTLVVPMFGNSSLLLLLLRKKRREEKRREGVETIQRKRQNLSGSRYPIVH
jgi:hypothetical protein